MLTDRAASPPARTPYQLRLGAAQRRIHDCSRNVYEWRRL